MGLFGNSCKCGGSMKKQRSYEERSRNKLEKVVEFECPDCGRTDEKRKSGML